MRALAGTSMVGLAVAAFLASLSLVSWRQGEALRELERLEVLEQECLVETATLEELENKVRHLESWGRVVEEAESRLGMRRAESTDIILLPAEDR
jgi:hypothetical protein